MLPERIVDLQHWDTHSGTILNHLADSGWQTGTMPYGIDPDEPIPEILSDHETLQEPASKPPVREKSLNPASAPQTPQAPPGSVSRRPLAQSSAPALSQIQQLETTVCIFPNLDIAKRSASPRRTERGARPFSTICGSILLLVLISLISKYSRDLTRPLASTTQIRAAALSSSPPGQPPSPSLPLVRRALRAVPRAVPVLTCDDKPVCRALPVVVRRAQLVRLP